MNEALTFQETWDLAFQYAADISARLSRSDQNESAISANVDYGSGMFSHDGKIYWLNDGLPVPVDNYLAQEMKRSGAVMGTSIEGNKKNGR